MKVSTTPFWLLLSLAFLWAACSPHPPERWQQPPTALSHLEEEESLSTRDILGQAENFHALGNQAAAAEQWISAEESYAKALQLLSTLDLSEVDPIVEGRYNRLLRELAEIYPQALSHLEELPAEGSLDLLSLKLAELRSDSLSIAPAESVAAPPVIQSETDSDMPLCWNEQVENSIRYFQTECRQVFSTWLNRSGRYRQMMQDILREYGLPQDLIFLALIESGFNPKAYSWAHASGPWQFIASTGKIYGLTYDWWLDERRDPVKSTRAAAKYLKNLFQEFQDWPLALAAYNCGEVRVRKAIAKAGTRNFWKLSLPRQTQSYVPLFMAATIIGNSPEKYGFSVNYEDPLEYDVVTIDDCTDLKVAARCCGASYSQLQELNPELRRWCTPPNHKSYSLKIPPGTQEHFLANYDLVPDHEKITWHRHKIQKGETLSRIAQHYGTSIAAIQEANSLGSNHRIIAGKYLIIPTASSGSSSASLAISSREEQTSDKRLIYTVKKGDVLSRIAANFGVSLAQLRRWNNLRSGQYIYPGDKLTIYMPSAADISPPIEESFTELVYTVRRGDTLWNIAQDFGVSLSDLIRENRLKNPAHIKPGSKLKIKTSKKL